MDVTSQPSASVVADAEAFVARVNARLLELTTKANRASWVQSTFITDDTEELAADRERERIAATMELAAESVRFDGAALPEELARQIQMIKRSVSIPAPRDPAAQQELTRTMAALEGRFGKGQYEGRDLTALTKTLAESRDPAELLDAWQGWRTVSAPMREPFTRFVELANEGARDLGHPDLGAHWRSGYDMGPDAFAAEMERVWRQLEPLYDSLHTYTRAALERTYGIDVVPRDGLIPAHLLGNMWSQDWSNIYPLLAAPDWAGSVDLTSILKAKGVDEVGMVRFGEGFFVSLGFDPLPASFWERSMFTKPVGRDVECHPSAWDIDLDEDVRFKMCIEIKAEDFGMVHHELGHVVYDLAYRHHPFLFREGPNDGFHEAIGDTISLSLTPRYLVEVGLLDREPPVAGDLPALMKTAIERVPLMPLAMAIERWRWNVFSGAIMPADYNAAWWDLARRYQRVSSPVPRSEADFDVAAKYHVAASIPYAQYFIAFVLQFQFHRAFARQAGFTGPLHRFSLYGDKAAGKRFRDMLALGRSRPWREALFAMTGEPDMDATAVLEYFAPLKDWLDSQNAGS
jgi:peptidyl-dipeptidase A